MGVWGGQAASLPMPHPSHCPTSQPGTQRCTGQPIHPPPLPAPLYSPPHRLVAPAPWSHPPLPSPSSSSSSWWVRQSSSRPSPGSTLAQKRAISSSHAPVAVTGGAGTTQVQGGGSGNTRHWLQVRHTKTGLNRQAPSRTCDRQVAISSPQLGLGRLLDHIRLCRAEEVAAVAEAAVSTRKCSCHRCRNYSMMSRLSSPQQPLNQGSPHPSPAPPPCSCRCGSA